jgi:predicted dehydrogenase
MSKPLNVILVGCGGIAGAWLDALKQLPDVAVRGLVDLQLPAAEKRRTGYQLHDSAVGTDVASMIVATRPDIVLDCTIPAARSSVVQIALQHGCHVLSEKPMAATAQEGRHLLEVARQSDRLFAVMQNRRHDPRIRAIRSFLGSEALGEITTVNCDFYLGAHFGGFRDKMPHVLLLDMAIHSLDQARFLSGANPAGVYCHEWNPGGSWYAEGASAVAIFEMTNGVVCTYRGSWCAEGMSTSWECDWRIVGTKGSATWDGGNQFRAERITGNEGFMRPKEAVALELPPAGKETGHLICIRDFFDCVRSGREPETICTDNIKTLAMVLGAIESAERYQRVTIHP